MGFYPIGIPVETFIIAYNWGAYLGREALVNGVDVAVSSWRRAAPDTFPTLAKAGGNYLNSQLSKALMRIARHLGYEVREQDLLREMLYAADELFFSGTAAELTPIRSVDRIEVGTGKPGPATITIQERFMAIAKGRVPDPYGWLTPVPSAVGAGA